MVPLFGAEIKASQFYNDLGLQKQCWILLQMVKFKDFSGSLSVFPVLFKANFTFKDFSRVLYIQVLFKPVQTLYQVQYGKGPEFTSLGFWYPEDLHLWSQSFFFVIQLINFSLFMRITGLDKQ